MGPSKLVHDYEVTKKELNETQQIAQKAIDRELKLDREIEGLSHENKLLMYARDANSRMTGVETELSSFRATTEKSISRIFELLDDKLHSPQTCTIREKLNLYVAGSVLGFMSVYTAIGLICKFLYDKFAGIVKP